VAVDGFSPFRILEPMVLVVLVVPVVAELVGLMVILVVQILFMMHLLHQYHHKDSLEALGTGPGKAQAAVAQAAVACPAP